MEKHSKDPKIKESRSLGVTLTLQQVLAALSKALGKKIPSSASVWICGLSSHFLPTHRLDITWEEPV
jgi:hypothetical protein